MESPFHIPQKQFIGQVQGCTGRLWNLSVSAGPYRKELGLRYPSTMVISKLGYSNEKFITNTSLCFLKNSFVN